MRLVLTHGYFLSSDPKEQEIMRPYPTLGLLYISAYLKEHHVDVEIIDSTFLTEDEWKSKIESINPDIVAFYTNLMTKVKVIELNYWLKHNEITTIIGGPDVTYNLDNYLNCGFDFAVIGEGEQTMLELFQAIKSNQLNTDIPGVSYLLNGKASTPKPRTKIKEISTLPFPDRKGIPIEKYLSTWKQFHGKRTLNISTQRGCPYTCKWCSTAVYGQSYRRNSPKKVVEEILHLKNAFDVEALWFVDDVFTVSHKWIKSLHQEFSNNKLTIAFECITRAERLNEEIILLLKEMGCFRIWIGAESGSQKIIDKMDRRVTLERVQDMMNLSEKHGIEAGTFIMVGYPDETHEDILATMDHIKKCNPSLLTITQAYPIKGTDLYAEVESTLVHVPEWKTSTDRDLKFKLPYSQKYYENAIRFLVNGWLAHKNNAAKEALKSKAALTLMNLLK